jgi:hypothetical protein
MCATCTYICMQYVLHMHVCMWPYKSVGHTQVHSTLTSSKMSESGSPAGGFFFNYLLIISGCSAAVKFPPNRMYAYPDK